MSRSTKKIPIAGITNAPSDKKGKQLCNRSYRRQVKEAIKTGKLIPRRREVMDVWDFPKDGKKYYHDKRVIKK